MSNGKKRKRDHSFTFRSLEHEKRYKTSILNQNFVQERAIALKPDEYREISNQVKIRNWETLISYPKPASKQLVKEFYTNAYQDENFTTYFRGKSIQFDPQTLNEFLKIKNPTTCGYMKLKGENVNAEKYLEILCKPGAQWTLSKENKPRRLNSEADILAQINFNAMESESKEGPAEAEPSCPKQEPREEDGLEED